LDDKDFTGCRVYSAARVHKAKVKLAKGTDIFRRRMNANLVRAGQVMVRGGRTYVRKRVKVSNPEALRAAFRCEILCLRKVLLPKGKYNCPF
jgi:hypothetical protein